MICFKFSHNLRKLFLKLRDSEQSRIYSEIFHHKACNIKNKVIIQVNQKHTEEKWEMN